MSRRPEIVVLQRQLRRSRRPPWWPADEAWPPSGHQHMNARRFGYLFLLAAVIAAAGLTAVTWGFWGFAGVEAAIGLLVGVVFGVALVASGFVMFASRQFGGPLAALAAASRAVEAGDYSPRVETPRWGPPPLHELVDTFNTMVERLEVDEHQRRTLLADIGHELRTPLAVVRAEIEAMLDGVYPADDAHLNVVLEETTVLARLIEDLRTLSLAEAGTLALHREVVDLGVLANEAIAALQSAAAEAEVTLRVAVAEAVPLMELDPVRIREVLSNLLANALRYAPAESEVIVAASMLSRNRVEVTVTDEGSGIDAELLPRLFDRFAKSEDSGGSGLGLSIVRELVAAHGGTIDVVPADGRGTCIRIELPIEA
jgi:signal transduction histidine kinase